MSLILKIMHEPEGVTPASNSERCFSLFSDITSIHFVRQPDGSAMAHCYVREPVKTADIPGFVENERWIDVSGTCFVLNENGRTVSSFWAPPADPRFQAKINGQTGDGEQIAA